MKISGDNDEYGIIAVAVWVLFLTFVVYMFVHLISLVT